jgi:hypothetical protein
MTAATVKHVDADQDNDAAPPCGTAIVRPLRHVLAVRERSAERYTDPAEATTSRSARAWAWALGETTTAPVTDRQTTVPPSRSDIEAEIAVAYQRRLIGERDNRADAAAALLRWLIGQDDHIPVRGRNRGELVGGFGDIVRSREQIADVLATAAEGQRRASAQNINEEQGDRRRTRQDHTYLEGVAATLAWVLGKRGESPIRGVGGQAVTTRDLKDERVHAEDVIDQRRRPCLADRFPSPRYGEGVKASVAWLLGDQTVSPSDPMLGD